MSDEKKKKASDSGFDRSSRLQSDEALKEREEQFKMIMDAVLDAIIIMSDKKISYWNKAAERIFGYTSREAIGQTVYKLIMPERFHKDHEKVAKEFIRSGTGSFVDKTMEHIAVRKNGEEFPMELSLSSAKIGGKWSAIGVMRDITKRKNVEETLKDIAIGVVGTTSEEIFYSLVEYLAKALEADYAFIGELDEKTNIVHTIAVFGNAKILDNFEYDLKGAPCEKVMDGDICFYPSGVQQSFPEDHLLVEMSIESYRGTRLIDSSGKAFGLMAVLGLKPFQESELAESLLKIFSVRASTELERKRTESEKEELFNQLLQSQKLESIGRMAGVMAHDFNNILTSIIGYSEIALNEIPDSHPAKMKIKRINRVGKKAAGLTNQLLAFSKKQVLDMKVRNLNTLINSMNDILLKILAEDIELNVDPNPDLKNIIADEAHIEQIIINLIINAHDAMKYGGEVSITTDNVEMTEDGLKKLKITDVSPGSYVMLMVSDTGLGISDEMKGQIFEPFFTTKDKGEGTGLGLSTVHGIVKQHGGFILLESEVGEGATFKVYLPAVDEKVEEDEESKAPVSIKGHNEKILIIEDNYSIRKLFADILAPLNYKLLEAGSGKEAIEISDEEKGEIDLIFADVILTGMDGMEAYSIIKKKRPDVKVIFISGYVENPLVIDILQKSDYPFIKKPFSPREMVITIREVLNGKSEIK